MLSYGVRKSSYILRNFDLYPGLHGWKDEKFLLPEGWKDEKFLISEGWRFLHFPSPSLAYSNDVCVPQLPQPIHSAHEDTSRLKLCKDAISKGLFIIQVGYYTKRGSRINNCNL